MNIETSGSPEAEKFLQQVAIESSLRIAIITVLLVWCAMIMLPFVEPIIWAMVIASATYPLFMALRDRVLGGRNRLAAIVFTLIALTILLVPSIQLTQSMFTSAEGLAQEFQQEGFQVPPPPEKVKGWPVIGESTYESWLLASTNLDAALEKAGPKINKTVKNIIDTAIGAGLGLLQFVISIIIAGVFLANASASVAVFEKVAVHLAGEQGAEFSRLAGATVRGVAQGVLGVAFLQAFLAGIGMLVMGIPAAGLWAMLVLMLAVVQLPPILVLGPVAAYAFTAFDTVPAVIFALWSFAVSICDSFLKPLLMGRGVSVPMLVIFIGAIGGFVLTGILGLFTGAVVFVLGYTLFMTWLDLPLSGEPEGSVQAAE
jgi:predicted PurR-regulated permease PerM